MNYQILCDDNGCTIKKRVGFWPFCSWQSLGEPFPIYGHTFDLRWPDAQSAQEYIEQILEKPGA